MSLEMTTRPPSVCASEESSTGLFVPLPLEDAEEGAAFFERSNSNNSSAPWIQIPPPDTTMDFISSSDGALQPATPSVR